MDEGLVTFFNVLMLMLMVVWIAVTIKWAINFFDYHAKQAKGEEEKISDDERFAADWFLPISCGTAILFCLCILFG